jgi:hypothetical protein
MQVIVFVVPGDKTEICIDEAGHETLAVLRALGLPTLTLAVQTLADAGMKDRAAAKKHGAAEFTAQVRLELLTLDSWKPRNPSCCVSITPCLLVSVLHVWRSVPLSVCRWRSLFLCGCEAWCMRKCEGRGNCTHADVHTTTHARHAHLSHSLCVCLALSYSI